jgi:hypothetical protein
MVFQEVLASHDHRVQTLPQTLSRPNLANSLASHWQYILDNINYHPIFRVAVEVLRSLPANQDIEDALKFQADRAREIVQQRAALRHDLMGRVYHLLLAEAKYLGTFYTSVPAATLPLKLALQPDRWSIDWSNLQVFESFRVGDLACGTGTLLMAAAEAISDNYVRASARNSQRPDLPAAHRVLVENTIHGYDVLPSALHLTASTLALRSLEVTFKRMRLYSLPLGEPITGQDRALGSLEFLTGASRMSRDLFGARGAPLEISAAGTFTREEIPLPNLDLCVMNPPFTRSVGGNLLFGNAPEPERTQMQRRLRSILRSNARYASITPGLGPPFVLTGHLTLRPGGRLALVLPKALLSGVAWDKTRDLLREHYVLEWIVVSQDPERWNFSENADLSEVLVVARKRRAGESSSRPVICVNLWRNPATSVEALAVARDLAWGPVPDIEHGQGALEVRLGDQKFAEAVAIPWNSLRNGPWITPCAFAQAELTRIAWNLIRYSQLRLPGIDAVSIPLVHLGGLGDFGPDRRDIWDGFDMSQGPTPYGAFWGHDSAQLITVAQQPNAYLSPLPQARNRCPLRNASLLWSRAGRLLVAERLWLITQRIAAAHLETPVLSNVWWPFKSHAGTEDADKVLALWLNSSLALVVLLALREETRGAWVDFKKPQLRELPVIDASVLQSHQLALISDKYDSLAHESLRPFGELANDPARRAIDDAFCQALNLLDLAPLRGLLSREPVLTLRRL